jgi:hypothetical protein
MCYSEKNMAPESQTLFTQHWKSLASWVVQGLFVKSSMAEPSSQIGQPACPLAALTSHHVAPSWLLQLVSWANPQSHIQCVVA